MQFVDKEPSLADPVLGQLLKFWPLTNSQKEVLFLGELEEILEMTQVSVYQHWVVPHASPANQANQISHVMSCQRSSAVHQEEAVFCCNHCMHWSVSCKRNGSV